MRVSNIQCVSVPRAPMRTDKVDSLSTISANSATGFGIHRSSHDEILEVPAFAGTRLRLLHLSGTAPRNTTVQSSLRINGRLVRQIYCQAHEWLEMLMPKMG